MAARANSLGGGSTSTSSYTILFSILSPVESVSNQVDLDSLSDLATGIL